MPDFNSWFQSIAKREDNCTVAPHRWQSELASSDVCKNRLIRIPTGMGKTLGVSTTWLWHRVELNDHNWPTRLVWCLPMRTLVEQTKSEAEKLINKLGWSQRVNVHLLMGGVADQRWHQDPEQPSILIGTQDMLLSRALNRGYAMGRAAWPRAFGLLNVDSLWVMDEVQLMDVGLTTSAQLQAFWHSSPNAIGKPRVTWWMSATLQPQWLNSVETQPFLDELMETQLTVDPNDRIGPQWDAKKPAQRIVSEPDHWTDLALQRHREHTADPQTGRQTLIVVNTVKQARELYLSLEKALKKSSDQTELRLIHSRFREADRRDWMKDFLSRETLSPSVDRILVATQVVEAGVDISASCLITELAPWPSLVQRFGRAARYGGEASVYVLDRDDLKKSLPYSVEELRSARNAIDKTKDVSIRSLEDFESTLSAKELRDLYPFTPLHVLLYEEFCELFDTSQDLSGADMDVSRFIRQSDDARDIQVFWREWTGSQPLPSIQPHREELCRVPIDEAKEWLTRLRKRKEIAWIWDYLEGGWVKVDAGDLTPGQVVLVQPSSGGYSRAKGFTGADFDRKDPTLAIVTDCDTDRKRDLSEVDQSASELAEEGEAGSVIEVWKTVFTHCREAQQIGEQLSKLLRLPDSVSRLVALSLRLHDWGKVHPSFASGTYRVEPLRTDLAKAPKRAWKTGPSLYSTKSHGPRSGFRHELASCLAVLELLRCADPFHVAILGNYQATLSACGIDSELPRESITNEIASELQGLNDSEFNLLLYLIASHHGKVRMSFQASPKDQDFPLNGITFEGSGMPIRGVRTGDRLPSVELPNIQGEALSMPEIELDVTVSMMGLSARYGASWCERSQGLLTKFGPFALGYLEAIVRASDVRSSDETCEPGNRPDIKLQGITLSIPLRQELVNIRTENSEKEPANV